jgi:hypothetical protein
LTITLSDDSVIRVASGDLVADGNAFQGKLRSVDPLRMSLTRAADQISGQINNVSLELGQVLIPDGMLDGNFVEIGTYFENLDTGETFYDENISGEILKSQIDDTSIAFRFKSDLDAADFNGKAVADEFPDVVVVPRTVPGASDDFSDLGNGNGIYDGYYLNSKLAALTDNMEYGRYYLPSELYY